MRNPFVQVKAGTGSFLPEDYITRKAELRASIISLTLFGVVMFCVVAAFFVTNREWLTVRAEQEAVNVMYTQEAQKIEQLKQMEAQRAQMLEKAEITTVLLEKVPRSVLLAELVTRMPEHAALLELRLESKRVEEKPPPKKVQPHERTPTKIKSLSDAGKKPGKSAPAPAPEPVKVRPPKFEYRLVAVGVAKENNDVADYLEKLRGCALLSGVELTYIEKTIINDQEFRKFELHAALRQDVDARTLERKEDLAGKGLGPAVPASAGAEPHPQRED